MAVDFLPCVPRCLLAFLPDMFPSIISVQLPLQVHFISEEQKLAAVFVIEEFAIQRMYCVEDELLKSENESRELAKPPVPCGNCFTKIF